MVIHFCGTLVYQIPFIMARMLPFLLLLAVSFSCRQGPDISSLAEAERMAARAANVEIIRDDFGVPHIYGKTDADAVFGLLYAQCEDDFPRVEQNYIWATGRLAEVEGERALYSDLRANLYMTREEAIAAFEGSPEWLKELCVAYADGINYYLETHPEVAPRLLTHFEPWFPMMFSEGSIGGDIERVSTRAIGEFYGGPERPQLSEVHDGLIRLRDEEPRGSNGFAIAGDRTASGNAMLLINPHTSFYFRGEVHVVSEEGLNAYGAVTWGQFFVYQGFNEKTGWMHTSTGTDILDEFAEDILNKEGKLSYRYGEELRPVDSLPVTLAYKTDSGMEQREFMMYRTHHGPITHREDGKWIATALMWDPETALIQSYTRTKTSGHDEFREMMNLRRNSSNNTVFADAEGNIAYYHGNFIPKRDTSFDYTQPVDGSNPATDWQGLHTVDENILIVNPPNGWIQNCNSTPFTAADEYSPKASDYPRYMTSYPENFRGIHAIPLLREANDLTLDGLLDLAYDTYLPPMETATRGVLAAMETSGTDDPEMNALRDILADWDYRVDVNSVAMTVMNFYLNSYARSGVLPRRRLNVAAVNYMSQESEPSERLAMLRTALDQLEEDFGQWEVPWGEFNRFQRLDGAIRQQFDDEQPSIPVGMASGRLGALASYGARRGENTVRQYGTSGNSFVAVVEFGDRVQAKTMLAGGQSGDPDSPHFADQSQRYADREFKDAAYYRKDVEARANKRYRPGQK
jgi:acyl-homoserine-lactone acylase